MFVVFGCAQPEQAPRPDPRASREAYTAALERVGLEESFVGAEWLERGRTAARAENLALLPFEERLHFDPREPQAQGVVVHAMLGQRVDVQVTGETDRFFFDVLYLGRRRPEVNVDGAGDPPGGANADGERGTAAQDSEGRRVAEIPRGATTMSFEPEAHGYYLLRLQPEILRGGTFTLRASADASLEWPVADTTERDVWSVFGDPRDGGARVHHGIDIFAPRGTPILAASEAEVGRMSSNWRRGGNVITLVDRERGLYLYYAHLDEHRTSRDAVVAPGEVIGTVGNTGNAATTPPHLHIGIYEGSFRRPVDPWYFFVPPRDGVASPSSIPVAASDADRGGTALGEGVGLAVGEWARVAVGPVELSAHPPARSATVPSPATVDRNGRDLEESDYPVLEVDRGASRGLVLPRGLPVRLVGFRDGWALVQTPSHARGYVPAEALEPNGTPTDTVLLPRGGVVRRSPSAGADVLSRVPANDRVALHGRYATFGLVLAGDGEHGWIAVDEG
jgi:murein DD-endopeptidase MepM/ murein hydrolase activator NlpD